MAKELKINQTMPFDFCDRCDKLDPVATVQRHFGSNNSVVRSVNLKCRNDWLCRQLKDNIDDLIGGDRE